jgi:hypothetical protein
LAVSRRDPRSLQKIGHLYSGICLAGEMCQAFAFDAFGTLGLFSQAFRVIEQPLVKRSDLFETTPLTYEEFSSLSGRERKPALSSPINAMGRAMVNKA